MLDTYLPLHITNYRCTLVKVKLSAGASLQILSSDKCFSAQIAQPRCSKIRFSAQDSGNMLTSSMVAIRPKMLSQFPFSVFFYDKQSCIFVMALSEYLTRHGFNSNMITGVFSIANCFPISDKKSTWSPFTEMNEHYCDSFPFVSISGKFSIISGRFTGCQNKRALLMVNTKVALFLGLKQTLRAS